MKTVLRFTFLCLGAFLLLLCLISAARRKDGTTIPDPPFKCGCRILVNEINLFSIGNQFVELSYVCETPPFQTTNVIHMDKYRLAFVSHKGLLLAVCHLRGRIHMLQESLYVVGHPNTDNINFNINDCDVAEFSRNSTKLLPDGDEFPVGMFLLRNDKMTVLKKLKLEYDGNKFRKTKMFDRHVNTIIQNMEDYYIIGSNTPYIFCTYFEQFYNGYHPNKFGDCVLRDWQNSTRVDRSLNRCPKEHNRSLTNLPMQIELWKYSKPSPGRKNLCQLGFTILNIQRKKAKLINGDCYSFLQTQSDRREFFRNPNNFDENLDLDANNQPPEILEPKMSEEEFKKHLNDTAPWIRPDCSSFPQAMLNHIQNIPYNPLPAAYFFKNGTCNWFEFLPLINRFRCKYCSVLFRQGILVDRPGSRELGKIVKGGVGYLFVQDDKQAVRARHNNKEIISKHEESIVHNIALDFANLVDSGKTGVELMKSFERKDGPLRDYTKATENILAAVIQSARMALSFRSHILMLDLLKFYDVSVGHLYHNQQSLGLLSTFVGEYLHKQLISKLLTERPELSLILDTSTDVGAIATIAILIQTYEQNKLVVYLYKLIEIPKRESSDHLFDLFVDALEEDGILNYVKEKLVSTGTDGGSNIGAFKGLLNEITKHKLVDVWCHNHQLELGIKDANKRFKILSEIDVFVNRLSKFMSPMSALRNNVLKSVFKSYGYRPIGLKKIKSIRWLAHRYRATIPILTRYEPIVKTLEKINGLRKLSPKAKNESTFLLQTIRDPLFLGALSFTSDVVKVLAKASLTLQIKGKSVIGGKELIQNLKHDVVGLSVTMGSDVKQLLENVHFANRTLTANMSFNEFLNNDVMFGNISLNGSGSGWTVNDIANFTKHYIPAIVAELDKRFKNNITDLFEIFVPLNIPINNNTILAYGLPQLSDINTNLDWGYNIRELHQEWITLLQSLIADPNFDELTQLSPDEFWTHYLGQEFVLWGAMIKTCIKNVLSIPISSASAESVYSQYTFLKDRKRYSLSPRSVENLIRIRYNGFEKLEQYDLLDMVRTYLKYHSRSDDRTRAGSCRNNAERDMGDGDALDTYDDEDMEPEEVIEHEDSDLDEDSYDSDY